MFVNTYDSIDRLFERFFEQSTPVTTTYVPSKFAVDITDEKAVMALAVLGHDVDDIEINCYEDKIEVKSNKPEEK